MIASRHCDWRGSRGRRHQRIKRLAATNALRQAARARLLAFFSIGAPRMYITPRGSITPLLFRAASRIAPLSHQRGTYERQQYV